MSCVKTVLFDFDGTLANTLPVAFHSFQQIFLKYEGKQLSNEDIIDLFGPTRTSICLYQGPFKVDQRK